MGLEEGVLKEEVLKEGFVNAVGLEEGVLKEGVLKEGFVVAVGLEEEVLKEKRSEDGCHAQSEMDIPEVFSSGRSLQTIGVGTPVTARLLPYVKIIELNLEFVSSRHSSWLRGG
ncbi:hypothetical protein ElyMa_003059100 [Elysia marginata]|uniref:Uncharacterized protein n=1 Tax=Elysia marginata TaxID=1093978 RepID=A0AAV4IM40_9GAST|nr:hypothetical protein ElyMa_003059100 [Elysia marginata]